MSLHSPSISSDIRTFDFRVVSAVLGVLNQILTQKTECMHGSSVPPDL